MINHHLRQGPHLILKAHVTLPPHTLSVVPVRVTDPKVVNSNQYLIL